MKIDLYAKKIGERGHVFLSTVDVPDSIGDQWLIPVYQPIKAFAVSDSLTVQNVPQTPVRRFILQRDILGRILENNLRYLEK